MGLFNDLLNLLRPPPPPKDEPAPAPPTVEELAAMQARVQAERGEAEALIASAAHRRNELLLQPGSDAAIRKLERDTDAAYLLLERLDRLEPELRRQMMTRRQEGRAAAWAVERSRVIDQLQLCRITAESYFNTFADLIALRGELDRAGFGRETDLLPWRINEVWGPAVYTEIANGYANRGLRLVEDVQERVFNVRFLQFTTVNPGGGHHFLTGYQAGQEAGFGAEMARQLIEQKVAELADPKPLPPAPVKAIGPHRTREEELRYQAAHGRPKAPRRDGPAELPREHPRAWTPLNGIV